MEIFFNISNTLYHRLCYTRVHPEFAYTSTNQMWSYTETGEGGKFLARQLHSIPVKFPYKLVLFNSFWKDLEIKKTFKKC